MAYVKIDWTEETAITHTRLNLMETQYDEFYSSYDGHNHDSRYYTEAEADARFFDADNDGAGSGLDADTVDGYNTAQIEAEVIPRGAIGIWSGSYESIPAGYVACNGLNSTPDLRDRFVVGAGGGYSRGDTGGYATRTPTGTLSIAGHSVTIDEMPSHNHSYDDIHWAGNSPRENGVITSAGGGDTSSGRTTGTTGSGSAHGHSGSTIVFDAYNNQPPYHALWWIMRSLS